MTDPTTQAASKARTVIINESGGYWHPDNDMVRRILAAIQPEALNARDESLLDAIGHDDCVGPIFEEMLLGFVADKWQDEYLQVDDTQVGVEFALRKVREVIALIDTPLPNARAEALRECLEIAREHCPSIPHDGPADEIQEAEYCTAGLIITDITALIDQPSTSTETTPDTD